MEAEIRHDERTGARFITRKKNYNKLEIRNSYEFKSIFRVIVMIYETAESIIGIIEYSISTTHCGCLEHPTN